jgi:integrase
MARQLEKLTAREVDVATTPGYLHDGGGLYLQISGSGSKSWVYRFTFNGKRRESGLGRYPALSLANARVKCRAGREQVALGIDPIVQKAAKRAADIAAAAAALTFKQVTAAFIKAKRGEWSLKHAADWESTFERYAYPILGALPCAAVTTPLVLQVLEPEWGGKTATMQRLQNRLEVVLEYATSREYRTGPNPARWVGHLENTLAAPRKIKGAVHHKAMDYRDAGEFMAKVRATEGMAARALELALLTAVRAGEARLAVAGEFDLVERVWVIPADRMKGRREFTVPLSEPAMKLLEPLLATCESGESYVFPGTKHGQPTNDRALLDLTKKLSGDAGLTDHGRRSTFRDWAAETTSHDNFVVEMALAHAIESGTEAAYRRGDLLEKRRRLMNDWAGYVGQPRRPADVVTLRTAISG